MKQTGSGLHVEALQELSPMLLVVTESDNIQVLEINCSKRIAKTDSICVCSTTPAMEPQLSKRTQILG